MLDFDEGIDASRRYLTKVTSAAPVMGFSAPTYGNSNLNPQFAGGLSKTKAEHIC